MRSQSEVKKEESCFHSQAISIPTSLAPLFEGDKKERGGGESLERSQSCSTQKNIYVFRGLVALER